MCSKVTHRILICWLFTLWFMINCNTYFRMMPFFCFHISQGSVATHLKRGGIFEHEFVASLPPSRLLKKFWKSVNIWWSYGQEFGVLFFGLTVYIIEVHTKRLRGESTAPGGRGSVMCNYTDWRRGNEWAVKGRRCIRVYTATFHHHPAHNQSSTTG